ncbi:MAG TPA: hypothetical protein VGF39_04750, partial [Stellaceae bacterium]
MASRLEGRVRPNGGNDLLRLILETGGQTYTPALGDERISLEMLVMEALRRCEEEGVGPFAPDGCTTKRRAPSPETAERRS